LAGGLTEKVIRVVRSKKKWAAATVGVAVIATSAAVALGSGGSGFAPTNLVTGNLNNDVQLNSDRVKFQTKDLTYVRVQTITFSPGGYSGWHHHPGIVIATVLSGAVTFTRSDCSSQTYGPGLPNGAVFVESGDHPGQASSADGATLYATFVAPNNGPVGPTTFRIEDDAVSCP
jgi:quercetin dioxygenase-like cupin family protein